MARIHGRPESKGWTHSEAIGVIERARDVRLREAAGTYGTSSDEPADGSLRRLMALQSTWRLAAGARVAAESTGDDVSGEGVSRAEAD